MNGAGDNCPGRVCGCWLCACLTGVAAAAVPKGVSPINTPQGGQHTMSVTCTGWKKHGQTGSNTLVQLIFSERKSMGFYGVW